MPIRKTGWAPLWGFCRQHLVTHACGGKVTRVGRKPFMLLKNAIHLLTFFLAPLLLIFLTALWRENFDFARALSRVGLGGVGITLVGSLVFWMWDTLSLSESNDR